MRDRPTRERIRRKADRGFQGYPIGTVAFYGPDNRRASKVVVGIKETERGEIADMRKWFGESGDLREDAVVGAEILAFLQSHRVRTVVVGDGILGCPHEEEIDYPLGEDCPRCPYWAGRARPI